MNLECNWQMNLKRLTDISFVFIVRHKNKKWSFILNKCTLYAAPYCTTCQSHLLDRSYLSP